MCRARYNCPGHEFELCMQLQDFSASNDIINLFSFSLESQSFNVSNWMEDSISQGRVAWVNVANLENPEL